MTKAIIEEEHIATLAHPDEYAKHVSQIASVSTHKLVFIKRKMMALTPFELVQFPISECSSITYEIRWAIASMVFGAIVVISIISLFIFGSVPGGTTVPIGAIAITFMAGAVLLRGPRRHRLTFVVNGKKLRWQSKAGDFKYKIVSTQKVREFAKLKGLLRDRA
jgi:hypothetical protein